MTIYQLFLETSPGYQEFDPQIMVDDEVSSMYTGQLVLEFGPSNAGFVLWLKQGRYQVYHQSITIGNTRMLL